MKLITWNIQWCRGCDGRVDPARIIETVCAFGDFDILCLQEVADGFPGLAGSRGEDQFRILAAMLPGYEAIAGVGVDAGSAAGARARFGNLLLSRLPVRFAFRHLLAWPADPNTSGMQRVAVEAVIDAPGGPMRVITTHLEYYSELQRAAQVEHLRALHAQACAHSADKPDPRYTGSPFETRIRPTTALLCGDFNFRPESKEYSRMIAPMEAAPAWVDAWNVVHPGARHLHTNGVHDRVQWPHPHTCDFIFVTTDLAPRLRRFEVDLQTSASDHQPLLVEIDPAG